MSILYIAGDGNALRFRKRTNKSKKCKKCYGFKNIQMIGLISDD
jgi:hypothetical protein